MSTTSVAITVQSRRETVLSRLADYAQLAKLRIAAMELVVVAVAMYVAASGPVDVVFARPRHPYTQGLLRSVPRLGIRRLEPIPGHLPTLAEYGSGCRFYPRCPLAEKDEHCVRQRPALEAVGPGHRVGCWKVEERERAARR